MAAAYACAKDPALLIMGADAKFRVSLCQMRRALTACPVKSLDDAETKKPGHL